MELDFYKLQLCGNDFILFNFFRKALPDTDHLGVIARRISRRINGVGSNGVIFLSKDPEYAVRLHYFNFAGKEQTSHDAYLCAAKFIFDYGIEGSNLLSFRAGDTPVSVESIDSKNFRITAGIPSVGKEEKLSINEKLYAYTPVYFKDPGASFFFFAGEKEEKEDIAEILNSKAVEQGPLRTVFTSIYSNDEIEIEPMFKRSVRDMIFAAAIAGTASITNNYCDNEILVNCKGDKLFFQWEKNHEKVFVTGTPDYIFRGTYYYDESDT